MAKRLNQQWLSKQTTNGEKGYLAHVYDIMYDSNAATKFLLKLMERTVVPKVDNETEQDTILRLTKLTNDQGVVLTRLSKQLDEEYVDQVVWDSEDAVTQSQAPANLKLN